MRLRLIIPLILCAAAYAQLSASVINGDVFGCFQMSGAPSDNLNVINVEEGMPFTRAWRLSSSLSINPWDIRIRCFNTAAVTAGDTLVASFWLRTIKAPEGGAAATAFVVERNDPPYTKSVNFTTGGGANWKKVEVPFNMAESYPAGAYNISLWLAYGEQVIDIGGLTVNKVGHNVPFSSLGLASWPYDGHAADAPWRAAADARIEKIRKADIAVVVRDSAGNPVPDAPVHVKMLRHAFRFGSAVDAATLRNNATYAQHFLEMFNAAVPENDLKWPQIEAAGGEDRANYVLNWIMENHLQGRGHNLVWPNANRSDYVLPSDVIDLIEAGNAEALRTRINDHITRVVNFAGDRVIEWDVLNEPVSNHAIQNVLGDSEMAEWFRRAREANSSIGLYVNDWGIATNGGYNLSRQNAYYDIISGIVRSGAPLTGVGLQSHFDASATPPDRVLEILDRFSSFGNDISVTEFDMDTSDQQLQADYLRDYLTICFSHPAVKGFFVWGFWEGAMWKPQGAMYTREWQPKPNQKVWMDLIYNRWWTDVQGRTGPDGVFRTRGFLGDYSVILNEGTTDEITRQLTVAGNQPNYVLVGKQAAGAVAAADVLNAASHVAGPVAPGEMVEIRGTGFGASWPMLNTYEGEKLPKFGGDTRVFFDGVEAPLIYSMRDADDPAKGRVMAVVPYSVSGSTSLEVEYLGTRTPAVPVPVAAAAPGIFCYNGGTGQAVAVNHRPGQSEWTLNGEVAAAHGDYLEFYITGEGQTDPPGVDGLRASYPNNPVPVQDVVVRIGGAESRKSECEYNWIGQIYPGVLQINACVPAGAQTGSVPLEVTVGGRSAQQGVTVMVQ